MNDRINARAGEELNAYRYGKAQSIDDLRWRLEFSSKHNGVPFITGLHTSGLPGWGAMLEHAAAGPQAGPADQPRLIPAPAAIRPV